MFKKIADIICGQKRRNVISIKIIFHKKPMYIKVVFKTCIMRMSVTREFLKMPTRNSGCRH